MELNEYIARFSTWVRTAYPDLDFLAPGGVLLIRESVPEVQRLRLELPGQETLSLHAVVLDLDGERREYSHIERQGESGMDVLCDGPVTLNEIRIQNADVNESERVKGLRVTAYRADEEVLLYDGGARALELEREVEAMLRHSTMQATVDERELATLLRDIALGRFAGLRAAIRDLTGATPQARRQIRRSVNATLLAGQRREWNIHSVRRTFRYWEDEERRRYIERANDLISDLRDLSDALCLGFGAVLGLVREGGLIAHDDDLDVIIAFEPEQAASLAEGLRLVEEHLRAKGYVVWGERQLAHRWVTMEGQPKIDVFVGLFEDDTVSWFPGPRGVLKRDDVFPPLRTPLLERDVLIPRNPTVYLEKVYGPRWRTPNPTYSHRWGRKRYEDIAGGPDSPPPALHEPEKTRRGLRLRRFGGRALP